VHELGHMALDTRERFGVEAEREDVLRPRVAGELRVEDLVGTVREALEEVSDPAPAVLLELRLVDDVGPGGADGFFGFGSGLRLDDAFALAAERFQVAPFVLVALAADQVSVEVDTERLRELAARDGELQRRQVRAGEERIEVGGGQREAVSALAHIPTLARTQEASAL
jgi:hypothetical protein